MGMLELNESQAGDPSALSADVHAWAAEQVFRLARNSGAQPQGLVENFHAFTSAVDFNERWIQGLVAFHVCLWLTVLVMRRNMTVQYVLFFTGCALLGIAEPVNTRLREKYWVYFARQNYFDERGVFAVVMFTGPLVALMCLQLVLFVWTAADLLVKVKREELRRSRDKKAADAAGRSIEEETSGLTRRKKSRKQQ